MGKKNKIPDRWDDYKPYGTKIANTRFMPLKVPLKEEISRNVPVDQRFTPEMLLASVPNLGLVIDLTNTQRYYDPQVFLQRGIQYEKIFCPGGDGNNVPSKIIVEKFFSIVEAFTANSEMSGKVIGVHCTHGINRTGYLICRYMIDRLGISPEEAVRAYHKGRGYAIERREYIRDLLHNRRTPAMRDFKQPPVMVPPTFSYGHYGSPMARGSHALPVNYGYPANTVGLCFPGPPMQNGTNAAMPRNFYNPALPSPEGSFKRPMPPSGQNHRGRTESTEHNGHQDPRLRQPLRRVQSDYFLPNGACSSAEPLKMKNHEFPKGWNPSNARLPSSQPVPSGFAVSPKEAGSRRFKYQGFTHESPHQTERWWCHGRAWSCPNIPGTM